MHTEREKRGALERHHGDATRTRGIVQAREYFPGAGFAQAHVPLLLTEELHPGIRTAPAQPAREHSREAVHDTDRAGDAPLEVVPVGGRFLWRPELVHEPIGDCDQRRLDGGEGWQVWMHVAHRLDIEIICSRARRAVPRSSAARTGFAASRRKASTSLRSQASASL